jgi:hypothetical protein
VGLTTLIMKHFRFFSFLFLALASLFFSATLVMAAGGAGGGSTSPPPQPVATPFIAPVPMLDLEPEPVPVPEPAAQPTLKERMDVQSAELREAAAQRAKEALPVPIVLPKVIVPAVKETVAPVVKKVTVPAVEKKDCYSLKTRKDRIRCRLEASEEQIKKELEKYGYEHEECRVLKGTEHYVDCVECYQEISEGGVWELPAGPKRIAAVKRVLGLPQQIVPFTEYCKDKGSDCTHEYVHEVYMLIKFRFYDAEERAEIWNERGFLTLDETVEFVDFIADAKIRFDVSAYGNGPTGERRALILEVSEEWRKIVNLVRSRQ